VNESTDKETDMTITLPTERPAGRPFDPPEGLTDLRQQRPLTRLTYPDGHVGWLATSHALVREVLADQRFSVRPELRHLPTPGTPGSDQPPPAGFFIAMDPPDHSRYRRLLTGQFTVRRMQMLAAHITSIADGYLDDMDAHGGPLDLVAALTQPLPAQVMCELLGVPYADRSQFEEHALGLSRLGATPAEVGAAYVAVQEYMRDLVIAKRADPTDDLLSGLADSDLTEDELTNIGVLLLTAGLDTTANMLGLGTFALLDHPTQLAALRADPGLAEQAVEELMRYLSIVPFTVRTAREDLTLDGELIKAGESVTVSLPAANRDPQRFADPDTLDLLRPSGGHVGFGHGIHQCLGQQLARVEMQVVLPALLARFPQLRLAVPAAEVAMRTDMLLYGVHELPVAWKE
jgi:cytochrome P450